MKERINWIDWAKALAVMTVVFCHLPQSQEWFYFRFLQTTIISVFFWASGYLRKERDSTRDRWRKYWTGLILPYIVYNAAVYPFWLAKYYMQNGAMPDLLQALRPVLGALLLQHNNAYCEPLNGPLWYLPAILAMHLILDLCRRTRHPHRLMTLLCIGSAIVYGLNNKHLFMPDLTPIGILRGLPFFYLGWCMQKTYHSSHPSFLIPHSSFLIPHSSFLIPLRAILWTGLSILFFHWHLSAFHQGNHWLHIALFYPTNLFLVMSIIALSRALDGVHSTVITNLSVGTLVIIGLHFPLISAANLIVGKALHLPSVPCYEWYEALPIALAITALLYPVILFAKRHAPWLLGRGDCQLSTVNSQLSLTVCLLVIVGLMGRQLYQYYSYAEDQTTSFGSKPTRQTDTLLVAIIGDSWAAYHHALGQDTVLAGMLTQRLNRPVSVVASGMVGAKTKTIYQLMTDSVSTCGTKRLLERRPDYCVISAGINDCVAKMGGANYVHHYSLMLKQLLANGIKPVVLDMPDVGYTSVYQRESTFAKLRHQLSSRINGADLWSFEAYRQQLKDSIARQGITDKTIYIDAANWNPDGYRDARKLYMKDDIHLTAEGYQLLDACIASHIAADIDTANCDSQ